MNELETPLITRPNAERMTWEQICQKYPEEWVILIDVDWINDTDLELRAAVVIDHSKRYGEALRRTRDVPVCTHLHTGKPKGSLSSWRFRR